MLCRLIPNASWMFCSHRFRKSSSSKLAVDERQTLETLLREEKTSSRTLAQLTEKQKGYEEKKELRSEDLRVQTARKNEVCRDGMAEQCVSDH